MLLGDSTVKAAVEMLTRLNGTVNLSLRKMTIIVDICFLNVFEQCAILISHFIQQIESVYFVLL